MTELIQQQEIFQDYLRKFEPVLAQYGYIFSTSQYESTHPDMESMRYNYLNKKAGLQLIFSFVVGKVQGKTILLGFTMHGNDRQFFSLSDFFEGHPHLKEIKTRFSDQGDFDSEAKTYFSDLSLAFETYLNGQITGKEFEDHKKALMDSYYESSAPYEMQRQVVSDAISDRANKSASLWGRLKNLFK